MPPPADRRPPVPAVEIDAAGCIGASFDLLTRTSDEMRRASFYIGLVVLGTVGPFALASWALEVVSIHHDQRRRCERPSTPAAQGLLVVLGSIAVAGLLVAVVESRAMATAILGARLAGRPLTVRGALARSRMSLLAGRRRRRSSSRIPVAIAQAALSAVFVEHLRQADRRCRSSRRRSSAALVGAPLAYVLSGIVLGDVDPFEATRRSFRVFRARKVAAALVAVFETAADPARRRRPVAPVSTSPAHLRRARARHELRAGRADPR